MKKYKITITNKSTKEVVNEFEEISNTQKYLKKKYELKYRFDDVKVSIIRLRKKAGVQTDLLD